VLLAVRVLRRLFDARPTPEPMPRWMHVASKAVQGLLYLLLFAVPLTAILGAWFEGHPLTLLAGVELAPPFGESHALGEKLAEVHTWLGDVILWLAGFHALAALFHHFVLGDGVFASMLPGWATGRVPDER
jgi:cytochrome b561